MTFLAGLLAFFGLLFLLFAVVAVVAPSLFKNKKTGEVPKQIQMILVGLIASVISFTGFGMLAPTPVPQIQVQENNQVTKAAPEPIKPKVEPPTEQVVGSPEPKVEPTNPLPSHPDKTLGVSPEVFRHAFNQLIGKIDTDYKIAELDIDQGEVHNSFMRMVCSTVGLSGTLNKSDGSLRDITLFVSGSDSPADNLKSMAVIFSATQVLNSNVEKKENAKAVMEVVQEAFDNKKTGKSVKRRFGKLQYSASVSDATPLIFTVSQP